MTQHLVLVADSDQCTLEISTRGGGTMLMPLEWAQGQIKVKQKDALGSGRQSISLPSGLYHLSGVEGVTTWSVTSGKCTVVMPSFDGEDPWPVPPAAWANIASDMFRAAVRQYLAGLSRVGR